MDVHDDILVTVATVINPEMRSDDGNYMEVISYNHQYNSRHDPNQPIKGKVSYHKGRAGICIKYIILCYLELFPVTIIDIQLNHKHQCIMLACNKNWSLDD